jgi:hypothetical protein
LCIDALHVLCAFGEDQTAVVTKIERLDDTPYKEYMPSADAAPIQPADAE